MPKDQSLYLQWQLNEKFSKIVKLLFFSSQYITFKSVLHWTTFNFLIQSYEKIKTKT